jgi:hypothetical protein
MANETKALIVSDFRIAHDPATPELAFVELAAGKERGERFTFVADAIVLDGLAKALTEAANNVRKRAN